MSSIFETAINLFNQGDSLSKLGGAIGTDSSGASKALEAAGPILIGGLADKAALPDGADQLGSLLDQDDNSAAADLAGSPAGDTSGVSLVNSIFGSGLTGVVSRLAGSSGLSPAVIGKILPALAPTLMRIIAKKRADGALSNTQVSSLLASEKADLIKSGRLAGRTSGDSLGGVATAADGAAGLAGGAAAQAKGAAGSINDTAKNTVGSVSDAGKGAVGSVGDIGKGTIGSVSGAAKSAAGSVGDLGKETVGSVGNLGKGAVGSVSGAAKGIGGAGVGAVGGTTAKASGMKWLWLLIAAVIGVIFLAWALTQCGDDDSTSTDKGDTAQSIDVSADAGADLQAAVNTALEGTDGVTGTVNSDGVVTLTGEVTDEAAKTSAEETAKAIKGITSVDNKLTITGDTSADADLQAAVNTALEGTDGVTGTVNSDGVVTLTGEVTDEAAKTSAEETAKAVKGITSIDNKLTITGDSEPETVNDELGLAPITFEVNKSVITPEGKTVLDEAAAYFEKNADASFEIGGHTDSDGDNASNQTLSQNRADAVKTYLEDKGIDAGRMTAKGYGESIEKVANDTPANKAINRRIEFTVK